ncbi:MULTISPECIES: hypothetical protein [Rhodomicrobium]|uniref:hypothetical protein n=1 Tax=Rhodomicrobium TaxID=1068 RepID=UPI000B4B7044|nr:MULTISPECIES: hypothetical protein [Rhodomicrobium]
MNPNTTDVARFALIIALGFLAFVIFLTAGTILGLMWVESISCNCVNYPIGLYVLGVLGLLFFVSMISESVDAPPVFEKWADNQREAMIIVVIFLIVVILLLI